MTRNHQINEQLNALADLLEQRQEAILQAWRAAADADPRLTTANSLPQSQFNDHIPHVLESYGQKLRAWPNDVSEMDKEDNKDATTHGLQRWHQGYRLREVTREWGHLQLVLNDELEQYAMGQPPNCFDAMSIARRTWVELCASGVSESTSEYFRLEQLEAAGHVRDLAQTLKDERELEQERSELWRQAAHDLRGHVGVVVNATTGLTSPAAAPPVRDRFLTLLQRSTASLHSMLDDVMGLARLQAGQERLEVKEFDAASLLSELCDAFQAHADERGLYLKAGGLPTLVVLGDPVKLRRIAQNLLLNALKYTVVGGVTVSWGDSRENDAERWVFTVRDTGPGFHAGPGTPLLAALKEATAAAHDMDREAGIDPKSLDPDGATDSDSRAIRQTRGEGIGLSIVKRLGDLMNATIELESSPQIGTSFRVALPRRYQPLAVSAAERP